MFVAEEAGLNLIAETGCIRTPKPYKVGRELPYDAKAFFEITFLNS